MTDEEMLRAVARMFACGEYDRPEYTEYREVLVVRGFDPDTYIRDLFEVAV